MSPSHGKGRLSVRAAALYCKEMGLPITRYGLCVIGKREGWVKDAHGHLYVSRHGLENYVRDRLDTPPDGWVSVSSMVHLARSRWHYYEVLKTSRLETRCYGRRRIRYAREACIRKLFE